MATYIPTNFGTVVARDRCRHAARLGRQHERSKAAIAWCNEATRAGSYWVRSDFSFWFSDADTALEFRMRWG